MPNKENVVAGFIDMLDKFETGGNRETDCFGLLDIQEEAWEMLNDESMAEEPIEKVLTSPRLLDTAMPLFCPSFVEEPEQLPRAHEWMIQKVRLPYPRHPRLKAITGSLDQENSDSYWNAFNLEALINSSTSKDENLEAKAAFVEELMTMALVEFGPEFLNEWVDEDFLELLKEAADEAVEETE